MSDFEAPFNLTEEFQRAELERLEEERSRFNERVEAGEVEKIFIPILEEGFTTSMEGLHANPKRYFEQELRTQQGMEALRRMSKSNKPEQEEE